MYEYDFHQIKLSFSSKPKEDYHEFIHKKASEGWRLVQVFAPGAGPHGAPEYYEFIFEKRKSD